MKAKDENGCFQWSKNTNLKANHNHFKRGDGRMPLFSMVQKY